MVGTGSLDDELKAQGSPDKQFGRNFFIPVILARRAASSGLSGAPQPKSRASATTTITPNTITEAGEICLDEACVTDRSRDRLCVLKTSNVVQW